MNTAETYLFAEYQSKIKALNYTVGIGAMRTYNSQEQYSSEKYIVKPSLSLSYSINGKWFSDTTDTCRAMPLPCPT